jgi:hypothetical protein
VLDSTRFDPADNTCVAGIDVADDDEDDGILNVSRTEHHCLTCMREHA